MLALIAAVTTLASPAEPPRDRPPPLLTAKVISCIVSEAKTLTACRPVRDAAPPKDAEEPPPPPPRQGAAPLV